MAQQIARPASSGQLSPDDTSDDATSTPTHEPISEQDTLLIGDLIGAVNTVNGASPSSDAVNAANAADAADAAPNTPAGNAPGAEAAAEATVVLATSGVHPALPTPTTPSGASDPDAHAAATLAFDPAADADFMRYYAVRNSFGNIAFSPDGAQVAYIVNTSGQYNIWRQFITGGWASQVTTFEDESARALIWAPGGELIGAADRSGSEQYDLFMLPAQGGALTYLTNQPNAQYELSEDALSPDGRYLAYSGNDREPTDGDVLVRDLTTGETRRLLANGRYNVAANWSPDGRYITVADVRSNTDLHIWLVEAATGAAHEALPHDQPFYFEPGPWLPDSSGFYVITDRGREFKGIARYSLAADTLEWLLTPDWDVERIASSSDGRRLIWTLNESGRSQLYLRDNNQAALRVSGLPTGVIEQVRLTPDGQTLALRINSATAPAELYIVTLGPIGSLTTPHLRRLTFGMLGGLAPSDLVEPELVSYPTFDGRLVPAWLYRPRNASASHKAPIVVSIHGGPEYQERVEYHAFYQYLLAKGIGVLAPNIRGSTGYGLAYQKLIHRDWGGAELKDIAATAEYAKALPWAQSDRIGVYGGSFGGFATLSAVARLPDLWAAAVDIVGPSNLTTFVQSVPPTWRRMMTAWVGDPETDADFLRERSPITYVDQVRAPLLVMQGANDPRVAQAESDQMVERLRTLGRQVEYVVFPDEGHGFTKRANTLRAYRLAAGFFLRHLLGSTGH